MEEMAKEEEEEERKERIESALDVTKQKDMSGFYRHIYRYNQRSFRVLLTYLQVKSDHVEELLAYLNDNSGDITRVFVYNW